jgi:hypothetical protein
LELVEQDLPLGYALHNAERHHALLYAISPEHPNHQVEPLEGGVYSDCLGNLEWRLAGVHLCAAARAQPPSDDYVPDAYNLACLLFDEVDVIDDRDLRDVAWLMIDALEADHFGSVSRVSNHHFAHLEMIAERLELTLPPHSTYREFRYEIITTSLT